MPVGTHVQSGSVVEPPANPTAAFLPLAWRLHHPCRICGAPLEGRRLACAGACERAWDNKRKKEEYARKQEGRIIPAPPPQIKLCRVCGAPFARAPQYHGCQFTCGVPACLKEERLRRSREWKARQRIKLAANPPPSVPRKKSKCDGGPKERPTGQTTTRRCLRCEKAFESEGAWNRLCDWCRRYAGQIGDSLEGYAVGSRE